MSNSLVKIIDSSLLPAVLLVFGKFIGIYLTAFMFNIEVGVAEGSSYLGITPLVPVDQLQIISTYSDLAMFMLLCLGFMIILMRAVYLHDSHLELRTVSKLTKINMVNLIKSSYELYHSAVTWFLFNWIAVLLILLNYILGKTEPWVFYAAFLFTIALTIIMFRDILREIELTKEKYLKQSLS